jgi:hypothetical protein
MPSRPIAPVVAHAPTAARAAPLPLTERAPQLSTLRSRLAALGKIAREGNADTPLGDPLVRIAETTCRLMGYRFCAILLSDAQRRRLIVGAAHGPSAEYITRCNAERPVVMGPGPFGADPSSLAFRTGRWCPCRW